MLFLYLASKITFYGYFIFILNLGLNNLKDIFIFILKITFIFVLSYFINYLSISLFGLSAERTSFPIYFI